ncbi:MAG TPA: undecaprenyl/decaprenyl-phosphate alpha-N-acetylglucosaminyl 1-phosphate transferase, partial [Pirellulales bacterium]|nr:undecaprenyl/decaprenyl-phosphate alpha-N-acetylglucosaminyl 1-phosphate transferase [Pirellulales bacterium]
MLVSHFGLLAMAFVAAVVMTVIVRGIAPRIGLVDAPDDHRKIHGQATPLGGGVAVLVATGVAVCLMGLAPSVWGETVRQHLAQLLPLGLAAAVLCAVGLVDDFKAIRARQKFLGQLLACLIAA